MAVWSIETFGASDIIVWTTTVETGADTICPFILGYSVLRVKPVFGTKLLVGW